MTRPNDTRNEVPDEVGHYDVDRMAVLVAQGRAAGFELVLKDTASLAGEGQATTGDRRRQFDGVFRAGHSDNAPGKVQVWVTNADCERAEAMWHDRARIMLAGVLKALAHMSRTKDSDPKGN